MKRKRLMLLVPVPQCICGACLRIYSCPRRIELGSFLQEDEAAEDKQIYMLLNLNVLLHTVDNSTFNYFINLQIANFHALAEDKSNAMNAPFHCMFWKTDGVCSGIYCDATEKSQPIQPWKDSLSHKGTNTGEDQLLPCQWS